MEINVNGKSFTTNSDPSTPLLWVLREEFKLTGTKYSCGIGACGACTVQVDGIATRSCITPISSIANKAVLTIEGLDDALAKTLRRAWQEENVVQCGYCQSGQIITAHALLKKNPKPNDNDLNHAMSGVLCRCGTYQRIRRAIHRSIELSGQS